MSLVSTQAVQFLQLPKTSTHVSFSGVQGIPAKSTSYLVNLTVSSMQQSQRQLQLSAAVVNRVTCDLPLQGASAVRELPHIRQLTLADPTFNKPGRVDLLIGCDAWADMMLNESKHGKTQGSIAWKTIFGWAIVGKYSPDPPKLSISPASVNSVAVTESTDSILARFWETEEASILKATLTPEEREVQTHFINTHAYFPSGRYSVTLPHKNGMPPLGASRKQALQRYETNERSVYPGKAPGKPSNL